MAQLHHHLNLCAKFGLHEGHFAELPSLMEYQQGKAVYGNSHNTWLSIDITSELALLGKNEGQELCVSVPMLGFTDPALDYSLLPMFAIPFSIHGLVALDENPGLSRAKVMARDIADNLYPLLTCPKGKIDYGLIDASLSGKPIFSHLKEITYIYNKSQLMEAQGLQSLTSKTPVLEMLLSKSGMPFSLTLSVKDINQKLLSIRKVDYKGHSISLPRGQLLALWQKDGLKNNLHIHYQTSQSKTLQEGYRARIDFDIPMQEGVEYSWKQTGSSISKSSKILRFTHYFGLSVKAFKRLAKCIIPFENFKNILLSQKQKTKIKSNLNCYEKHQSVISILHEHLLQGIANQSIPLFALSPYFVQADKIQKELRSLDLNLFDKHDQFVIKQLYQFIDSNENTVLNFIDEVDRLLSMANQTIDTSFIVQTKSNNISSDTLISANLQIDNLVGETYSILSQTPIHILNNNQIEKGANDAFFTPKLHSTKGAVYKVSLAKILQGADVIEDFNWRANDKINLSELLNALGENANGSTVVHARITPNGDTEIWVEHFSKTSKQPTNYHIATLKGVSTQHGNLPGDLNTFIEFRN
ncbi:MAG: type I secretion C-terminal target domain-containing protein [Gammaproteobacteria bacterium]|jgi:hypothetical protein|nr:type I secretion C-terminal target domain-containing protein [Gammaproteobacteria bacterium]